jgi:hypothetical protein
MVRKVLNNKLRPCDESKSLGVRKLEKKKSSRVS